MARTDGARSMMSVEELSVLIAGGGVAALEAALTLADVAEGQARVELLAPEPLFWYRPASVAEPFGLGTVRHFDLGLLAARAGAGMTLGALAGVDADRRLARTATGATLSYDALLIACGAQPTVAVPGALTFRGPADGPRLRALVEELEEGAVERVAFAVPSGSAWPLPAYELALMTARRLATTGTAHSEVVLVTPEPRPLHLFGAGRASAVGRLLSEAGVVFVGGVDPIGHTAGELVLATRRDSRRSSRGSAAPPRPSDRRRPTDTGRLHPCRRPLRGPRGRLPVRGRRHHGLHDQAGRHRDAAGRRGGGGDRSAVPARRWCRARSDPSCAGCS